MTTKLSPVICDGCEADITTTGNCEDYRLVLRTETPTPWYVAHGEQCGVVTMMAVWPAIKQPHHFCNDLDCLRAWLNGPEAVAQRKAQREERAARLSRR